jgi:type IV pilus assembly protein PilO
MLKLDALQDKPWYVHLAAFGAVALLVYGVFYYFVTSGTRAETAEVEAQVVQLQSANAGAQIASQRLNEFKANYARAQADYEDLKALLPEQRELTTVLANVQDRARGKLTLRKFTPKDDEQQELYAAKPVEIEVTGTYNQIGQFFSQMASYQRIVSITDFKVTRLKDNLLKDKKDGKTVNAVFMLKAYYVAPEKLQAAPAPGQPAPAPGQPAVNPTVNPSAATTSAAAAAAQAGANAAVTNASAAK